MLNFFLLLSLSDLFFFSYSFAFVCQEKKCTTFSLSLHLLQHFFSFFRRPWPFLGNTTSISSFSFLPFSTYEQCVALSSLRFVLPSSTANIDSLCPTSFFINDHSPSVCAHWSQKIYIFFSRWRKSIIPRLRNCMYSLAQQVPNQYLNRQVDELFFWVNNLFQWKKKNHFKSGYSSLKSNIVRHRGHVRSILNHSSRHFRWNVCWQENVSVLCRLRCSKQIAHCSSFFIWSFVAVLADVSRCSRKRLNVFQSTAVTDCSVSSAS